MKRAYKNAIMCAVIVGVVGLMVLTLCLAQGSVANTDVTRVKWYYYVFLSVESLAIVVTMMYLIMSKFNRKTLKETLPNADKIAIYALSTVIVTVVMAVGMSLCLKLVTAQNNAGGMLPLEEKVVKDEVSFEAENLNTAEVDFHFMIMM